ncbi:MAG TPA: hypothetical protein DCR24_01030 [Bacillus bacterium]|nr:hypothetical protein [Bacillus sp. (in: firmicutes)]
MQRAVILGVYDFIGYSLCRYMLDKGIEIVGIHFQKSQDSYFTEEKRLEIGRNANFKEVIFQEWNASSIDDILFISLYEEDLSNTPFIEDLMKKLEAINVSNHGIILLLPASLAGKEAIKKEWQQTLTSIFEKKNVSVLELYLPTIYGPWQPEGFFFQQSLNYLAGENKMPKLASWEWTHDAIYIEDAVKLIINSAEGREEGKFILASGQDGQWLDCAESVLGSRLEKSLSNLNGNSEIKENIKIMTVKDNEDITKGLSMQKEQYTRIKESRL